MKPVLFIALIGVVSYLLWAILMSDMITDLDTSPTFTFVDRFNLFTYPAVIGSLLGCLLSILQRSVIPLVATIGASLITVAMFAKVFDVSHGNPGYMFPAAHILSFILSVIAYIASLVVAVVIWVYREHRIRKLSEQIGGEESPTRPDSTPYEY